MRKLNTFFILQSNDIATFATLISLQIIQHEFVFL